MSKRIYDFVFGDMTIGDWADINEANQEALKGNMHKIINLVDKYCIDDVDSIPICEMLNFMEQFTNQLGEYVKEIIDVIGMNKRSDH